MKHESYKDLIRLAIAGELGEADERRLDAHLAACGECRAEMDQLRSFARLMSSHAVEPSAGLLDEARSRLAGALARESASVRAVGGGVGSIERARDRAAARRTPKSGGFLWGLRAQWATPRVATAAVVSLAAGILLGYVAFARQTPVATGPAPAVGPGEELAGQVMGGPGYSNVRFIDSDTRDGQIEVAYDLVRPVRLRAALDDERMLRLLEYALRAEKNDGVRLRALDVLNAVARVETPKRGAFDRDVKRSLIAALRSDPNPGVRGQALYALRQLPFDDDIKDACLYVLANDTNPGMRVASIDLLASATLDDYAMGAEVYDFLESQLEQTDNDYLKVRSAAFIQEVSDVQ